jgi:class 3 adenylate cyclase
LYSTLPELSLAMKAHAGYDIASGLLRTYLGYDAGARVHSGAVERGSVNGLHSVLWYADLRGFTRISDETSGAQIVEMLNEIFEMLTASLRTRGGHVLKFIGDAMLATLSFEAAEERVACNRGLEAAVESLEKVESRNQQRRAEGLPYAQVDIALHVGEVLYGNVGAADRLDFTVIGPAVNEVVRMEKLCEMLGSSPQKLVRPVATVLALLVWEGQPESDQATRAFDAGMRGYIGGDHTHGLPPREECSLAEFDAALQTLNQSVPAIKRRNVVACAACILANQQVTVREAELLRAICDTLDCPLPPLVVMEAEGR